VNADDVLNAIDPDWLGEARALMAAKRTFEVVNFVFSFDGIRGDALARKMNYRLHLDPDNRRAEFQPL